MEKRSLTPIYLRGVLLIIFGLIIMFYNEQSIKALGVVPGLIIAMVGLAQCGFAYFARKHLTSWQWYLGGGIVILIMGIVLMLNPAVVMTLIVWAFAAWFLFQAFQDFAASGYWRKLGHPNWWIAMVSGILSGIIGILFLINPLKGAMVVTTFIGLGMLIGGIMAISMGVMLRKQIHQEEE